MDNLKFFEAGKTGTTGTTVEFHESVTVSGERYEQLVRAEAERDIIRNMYDTYRSYNYDDVMSLIFGPKRDKESEGNNAEQG